MSKEIYKEYVNKYFFECESEKDRIEVNRQYLYCYGDFSGSFAIYHSEHPYVFVDLHNSDYECVKRKPKTQIINGHEVVAPRYDMPEHREDIIVMNFFSENGIEVIDFSEKTMRAVTSWGWFSADNTKDAIAYANAHKDNKND